MPPGDKAGASLPLGEDEGGEPDATCDGAPMLGARSPPGMLPTRCMV